MKTDYKETFQTYSPVHDVPTPDTVVRRIEDDGTIVLQTHATTDERPDHHVRISNYQLLDLLHASCAQLRRAS